MTLTLEKLTEILAKPGYIYSGMSPIDLVKDEEKATAAVRAIVARYPQKERAAVALQIAELAVDAAQAEYYKDGGPFAEKPPKAQSATEAITELGGFKIGERVRVLEAKIYEGHEGEICSFSPPGKVFLQLDGIKPPCGFSIANIEPVEPVGAPEAWDMVATETSEPVQLSLFDLIDLINSEHQKCEQAFGEMLLHAKKTGEYLTQAKGMVPHGGWLSWVKENCKFSHKTANRYVQIFEGWENLSNSSRVTNLSLRQALAVLAGDKQESEAEDIFEGELLPPAEPEAPDQVSHRPEPETVENTIPAESNPTFLPGDLVKIIDTTGGKYLIGKEALVTQILTNGNPLLRIPGEKYEVSLPARFCELIERPSAPSSPPAPEPVKPEEGWPMQYRQRVKLVDAPENYAHWHSLIGSEGYVVKCSQQKDKSWTITVKIDGEQWPAVLPENCWMELDYEPQPQPPAPAPVTLIVPEKPPLMARSGSDVYLTPKELWYPALIGWEMEAYSIDPATNDTQNPNVPAKTLFGIEENGLAHPWSQPGNAASKLSWCNPPFSQIADFTEKQISELELGNVEHSLFLGKCDCRTDWFEKLSENCNGFLLVHKAVKWVNAEDSSYFGVVIFYFGNDIGLFYRCYNHLGTVAQAIEPGMFGD